MSEDDEREVPEAPEGLGAKGAKLWADLCAANDFDPAQLVILEESCRITDRLDGLNDVIQGKGVLKLMHARVPHVMDEDGLVTVNLTVDGVMSEARQQANVLKQLITSLRLPDAESGKRPQHRGARGAYSAGSVAPAAKATGTDGSARVSSIDRARQRAERAAAKK